MWLFYRYRRPHVEVSIKLIASRFSIFYGIRSSSPSKTSKPNSLAVFGLGSSTTGPTPSSAHGSSRYTSFMQVCWARAEIPVHNTPIYTWTVLNMSLLRKLDWWFETHTLIPRPPSLTTPESRKKSEVPPGRLPKKAVVKSDSEEADTPVQDDDDDDYSP